ncbi:MAG: pimelyl-ACP methyl ester esterase BioV [Epsilonproteobacteria bacterium]|nr:pimelyl-ACP methyl ester esterase BioV [Campylobacterota bacterium]
MIFFSGFSLKDESYLFEPYIKNSDYTVCGFSYGAIKAFEYMQDMLQQGKRVDTLQLFSPAFFQTKDAKFKRLQLMGYKKDKQQYLEKFLHSCFAPYQKKMIRYSDSDTIEDLQKLLEYEWDKGALQELVKRGVVLEVYLGGEDSVIDVDGAYSFFQEVATVTYIKEGNHFLLSS